MSHPRILNSKYKSETHLSNSGIEYAEKGHQSKRSKEDGRNGRLKNLLNYPIKWTSISQMI